MCGLPAALSVIVTAPVRVPVAVGVNLTLILQLDPTVTDEPHVLVREKSPLAAMLLIFSAAVPVFFNVTLFEGLVVPTVCEPKLKVVDDRLTTGSVPMPVRLTVCGLPLALSVMVIAPVRVPVAVGVNVTLMVQVPAAATDVPQALVCA
jgi:hypothetical protein